MPMILLRWESEVVKPTAPLSGARVYVVGGPTILLSVGKKMTPLLGSWFPAVAVMTSPADAGSVREPLSAAVPNLPNADTLAEIIPEPDVGFTLRPPEASVARFIRDEPKREQTRCAASCARRSGESYALQLVGRCSVFVTFAKGINCRTEKKVDFLPILVKEI